MKGWGLASGVAVATALGVAYWAAGPEPRPMPPPPPSPGCAQQVVYKARIDTVQDGAAPVAMGLDATSSLQARVVLTDFGPDRPVAFELGAVRAAGLPERLQEFLEEGLDGMRGGLEYRNHALFDLLLPPARKPSTALLDAVRPLFATLQFRRSLGPDPLQVTEIDHLGKVRVRYHADGSGTVSKQRLAYQRGADQSPRIVKSSGTIDVDNMSAWPRRLSLEELHELTLGSEHVRTISQKAVWRRQALTEVCGASPIESMRPVGLALSPPQVRAAPPPKAVRRRDKRSQRPDQDVSVLDSQLLAAAIAALADDPRYETFGWLVDRFTASPERIPLLVDSIKEAVALPGERFAKLIGILGSVPHPAVNTAFVELLEHFQANEEPLAETLLGYQLSPADSSPEGIAAVGRLTDAPLPRIAQSATLTLGSLARRIPDKGAAAGVLASLQHRYAAAPSAQGRRLHLAAIGNMRSPAAVSWLSDIACCADERSLAERALGALARIADSGAEAFLADQLNQATHRSEVITVLSELQVRSDVTPALRRAILAAGERFSADEDIRALSHQFATH